ncbi:MAG: lipopolysaccharide heptosyltransferase II [Candidatus Omnitrophica bacterium]|nr:lipopolysaccharide heptosyltransferase II [Candidatus Omnitrophota bacterium]
MKKINKILFITLSNIGDAILTLPALDSLMREYPAADIYVMCAERPKELFENNPRIKKVIIFDKHAGMKANIKLFNALRKEKFDLVVDLRNTFFGAALPARYRTSPFFSRNKSIAHMRDKHLAKLPTPNTQHPNKIRPQALNISPSDEGYVDKIIKDNNISQKDAFIVIAPGARSSIKRWPKERFAQLTSLLGKDFGSKLALIGDKADVEASRYIKEASGLDILDLTGKTTLMQLAALLKKSRLLITNDSAIMHLASYLNVPVLAVFGPTDENKYGPWSIASSVVRKSIYCRPCEKAACKSGSLKCLELIRVDDVYHAAKGLLSGADRKPLAGNLSEPERILIVRTDRIGDALLSTPVIKAIRSAYPQSYIAMMVAPAARDIIEGNPYLDEVIIYDKDSRHKSLPASMRFAGSLAKKHFDLALILHPTNRAHMVTYFAGIPRRIGYDRKMGFLLTDRLHHTKQLGEKHEMEYALDLVRYLGIEPKDKDLFMPIKKESEEWADKFLHSEGITKNDKLLAIHPAASCISRIWPQERFAQLADKLAGKYGFKVLIIAGSDPEHINIARRVTEKMKQPAVNLSGKISLSQLASVLKRCQLYVSSDTGPMHIASTVGVPVVCLFGRSQAGLSPKRWGPLGKKCRVIHKDTGCVACLAHNCVKGFACFKAISVEDVVNAADSLLKEG